MMKSKYTIIIAALALCGASAFADTAPQPSKAGAGLVNEKAVAKILPGKSTKAQVESQLGKPYRIAQFTDCGHSTTPPGQNDEVWDYRGKDAKGTYHLHIEFGDDGVLTLISRIPDEMSDSNGFAAQSVPVGEHHHMMAGMKM
jgi:outer membrane protein assembly factor BamE (lipoprotein component of BamABCDE complex)